MNTHFTACIDTDLSGSQRTTKRKVEESITQWVLPQPVFVGTHELTGSLLYTFGEGDTAAFLWLQRGGETHLVIPAREEYSGFKPVEVLIARASRVVGSGVEVVAQD
jgi:hypothetical protein